jgi:hypothetical protein
MRAVIIMVAAQIATVEEITAHKIVAVIRSSHLKIATF